MDYHSTDSEGGELFLTQTKICENLSTEEWTDDYLHPEIVTFSQNKSSDDELCELTARADATAKAAYSDISSASENECAAEQFSLIAEKADSNRFKPPKSDIEMEGYGIKSLANSTKRKCKWAVELFENWRLSRNDIADIDKTISPILPALLEMTKDELCYSISRFLCEVKKTTGEEYPGKTLYEMVISLQLYLESRGKNYKLLQDETFLQLKNTLDHVMKERSEKGISVPKRKADVISLKEEELLWCHALGFDTPRKLVDTVLYLLGLNFAMRAGGEHRQLRWVNSQLKIVTNSSGRRCLKYTEDVSKGNQGGLKHKHVKQKVVYAYENYQNPHRCIVKAFELYNSHCPDERPAFYLRPLPCPNGHVWFSSQPIGINTLAKTVGRLCSIAGVPGFRTNHSLRATAATRLYEAEVDEQLISETTGHRSLSVREYKRTSDDLRVYTNSIVNGSVCETAEYGPPAKCGKSQKTDSFQESVIAKEANASNITVNINISK